MSRSRAALLTLLLTAGVLALRAADPPTPVKEPETWWSLKPIVKPVPPTAPAKRLPFKADFAGSFLFRFRVEHFFLHAV